MSTARDFLAAVQQRAEAQRAAHARMLELGGGVGLLGVRYPQMFEDMLAWDNSSEDDHADTVLSLVAALTAALDLADEYERDDREHLDRFGQHHPVAYHPYPHIRAAITAALTPKENDS